MTKIPFLEKGNQQPDVILTDLVFIINEKPHNVFTKDWSDLISAQKISWVESLIGFPVKSPSTY